MKPKDTLGSRIRKARLRSGLSQRAAADKMEVPYQRWQEWENDRVDPSASKLFAIAKVLRIRADKLEPKQ